MMRLILLFGLCITSVYAQEVYKVVHEDGSITYTDKPLPGAQTVQLDPVNSVSMPSPGPMPLKALPQTASTKPTPKLDIISPAAEATIRNNAGNIQIVAKITDSDSKGRFVLYLDNAKIKAQDTPVFQLKGINRGEHTFYISYNDNKGKTLASTPPRTFYLHQASRLINQ